MKRALMIVLLAAGSAAWGQSSRGDLGGLGSSGGPAPFGASPDMNLSALLGQPNSLGSAPQPVFDLTRRAKVNPLGNLSIDPRIAIHPSANQLGVQPPGVAIAQKQFPGLTLLPIDGPTPKPSTEPIPITWPNLKTAPIPTGCPVCRETPVHAASPEGQR
jgi:hypothetical protein